MNTILLLSLGVAALACIKPKSTSGVGAIIVPGVEKFGDTYTNSAEIEYRIKQYVEDYLGHVVTDTYDAYKWFKQISPDIELDDVHFGEVQNTRFSIIGEDKYGMYETIIHVRIEELYTDSGSSDYCYIVTVDEE